MGTNSKHLRYREAGEEVNIVNAERYGAPVRSLFTSTKFFTVHHRIDIMDEHEVVLYKSATKFWTMHDRTEITDANGNLVAKMKKKFWTLHERHYITMADGFEFQLSNELWHIYKDITNIEGLGWQLRGNMFALNFELLDQDGSPIAVISQKFISLHDKYCIDIYKPEYEQRVVAILVTLQHMIRDREAAQSASSSSYSSSN